MILIKINHHYLKVEHHSNSTRWSPIQSNIKYYTHVGVIFDLGEENGIRLGTLSLLQSDITIILVQRHPI
jgi:hypothetical protein